MAKDSEISGHYSSGLFLDRLNAALRADGVDPDRPTIADLAPYDQFHGRGLEATEEIANGLEIASTDNILDIGSGIGGPARFIAARFGCWVTGIDLTDEFCDAARHLTRLLGLEDRVTIEQGNALAMPFSDASFDGAYSMNVAMNIADKAAFYGEAHRVLKPGGWLLLSEIAQGPGGSPNYPTPWARTAESSFLATPEATLRGLERAGFSIQSSEDKSAENLAFGARSREMVERGEKPPQRSVQLIHGDIAPEATGNTAKGVAEKCLVPIEVFCRTVG